MMKTMWLITDCWFKRAVAVMCTWKMFQWHHMKWLTGGSPLISIMKVSLGFFKDPFLCNSLQWWKVNMCIHIGTLLEYTVIIPLCYILQSQWRFVFISLKKRCKWNLFKISLGSLILCCTLLQVIFLLKSSVRNCPISTKYAVCRPAAPSGCHKTNLHRVSFYLLLQYSVSHQQ